MVKKSHQKHMLGGAASTSYSAAKQICESAAHFVLCADLLVKDADLNSEMWICVPACGTTRFPRQRSLTLCKAANCTARESIQGAALPKQNHLKNWCKKYRCSFVTTYEVLATKQDCYDNTVVIKRLRGKTLLTENRQLSGEARSATEQGEGTGGK